MFVCPACAKNTLAHTRTIELPPDNRSDEITLQLLLCSECGEKYVAVYEESRRGAMDAEAWEHTAWRASEMGWERLAQQIAGCMQPNDPHCACPTHMLLGARDASGRWMGPPVTLGIDLARRGIKLKLA